MDLFSIAFFNRKKKLKRLITTISLFEPVLGSRGKERSNLFLPLDFGGFHVTGHASFWLDYYNNLDTGAEEWLCWKMVR